MADQTPNEWLDREGQGPDELPEAMLAHLMREIPAIEPTAAFVQKTTEAAWKVRTRGKRLTRWIGVAAILLISVSAGLSYELSGFAAPVIVRAVALGSSGLAWLLDSVAQSAGWWWIAETIGAAVSDVVAAPGTAAALVACELVGLLAIYAFKRLVDQNGDANGLSKSGRM